ncbi:MAG: hypothetical protein P1U56_14515 [Saprospiraceae bacterium]|nr:hypothetical protein [Saprospiraceae bacterium]
MELDKLDKKIEYFHSEIFKIEQSINRQAIIKHELELLYHDLYIHKSKMEKEHSDVLKLEKTPIFSLFNTILGNPREQLEKERQEYLQAVLEYNSIAHEIDILTYESEVLEKTSKETKELKNQLNQLLKTKEKKLLIRNKKDLERLKLFNKTIDTLRLQNRKFESALNVANVVKKEIFEAFQKLRKVKKFQYSNMSGAGRHSSFAKKSYIDGAIKDVSKINFFLSKLDKELSAVYDQYTFFSIYKYQNFVDSFYDNLITDWILQNKLRNALNCLQSAEDKTMRIIATLENDTKRISRSIEEEIAKKREFVRHF